ncbi:MAG TPA: prepilin-type N-terminal cleavage/methylation domain-containing protein, partial [Woeseiaceae bacterium]|nr:prepilin-type N-terminal cleavage/methylation domain-containing protein [Woeseiaceae bacterium]
IEMNRKQNGFTLIELVVVITILGIMAAFAFPRFAALQVEARAATVDGLAGSIRSAVTLAYTLDRATGVTGTVTMEGNTITMANGYPNLATIDDTLTEYSGFTYTAATGVFTKDGATTPADCSVDYNEAGAIGRPTIVVTTFGC